MNLHYCLTLSLYDKTLSVNSKTINRLLLIIYSMNKINNEKYFTFNLQNIPILY